MPNEATALTTPGQISAAHVISVARFGYSEPAAVRVISIRRAD